MKHVPKRTKGFTLMEVMVSIAIVGILFLPMLSFFSHAVKINVASKNMQRANAVGQSVIEEVKQYKNLAAMESAGYTLNGDGTYTYTKTNIDSDGKKFSAKITVDPDAYADYNANQIPVIRSLGSGSTIIGTESADDTESAINFFQLLYQNDGYGNISREEVAKSIRKTVDIEINDTITDESGNISPLAQDMATMCIALNYYIDPSTSNEKLKHYATTGKKYAGSNLYYGNITLSKLRGVYIFYDYDVANVGAGTVDILQGINTKVNVSTANNPSWEPTFTVYAMCQCIINATTKNMLAETDSDMLDYAGAHNIKSTFTREYNGNILPYAVTGNNKIELFSNFPYEVKVDGGLVTGVAKQTKDVIEKKAYTRMSQIRVSIYDGSTTLAAKKILDLTATRGE
ncbi:MAG: type II secretion system protein [Lachnospiraceae bacterium]|nr:type II secretion system protein [Lachnospiraceae bacterium]